jgi:hypothetical protein
MTKIERIHETTFRDATKLGLADLVKEVGVRIQTGEFDPKARVAAVILNPKGADYYKEHGCEEPYFLTILTYGPSNVDGIAMFELAKGILANSIGFADDD